MKTKTRQNLPECENIDVLRFSNDSFAWRYQNHFSKTSPSVWTSGDVTSELVSCVIATDDSSTLRKWGNDSADSAPVPCGLPLSCCQSPWLPSIWDDSNKISIHRGPRTRHYRLLHSRVFTQSDNYCKAPSIASLQNDSVRFGSLLTLKWMTGDAGASVPAQHHLSQWCPSAAVCGPPFCSDSGSDGCIQDNVSHPQHRCVRIKPI